MTRWALILICGAIRARAADPDPTLVLQRVAIKTMVRANTLPNYTCVQTVNRDFYRPLATAVGQTCAKVLEQRQLPTFDTGLRLILTDRLRLDVTLTSQGEIYSWVGASKFEDSGIASVVHQGPIATGSFGAFLTIIFGQDPKSFQYQGTVRENGRTLMEYRFRVEKEESHYKVRVPDSWVHTGYSGSIWLDPATFEVARMMVQTDELPEATGSCQTTARMEFGMVRIGDSEFPLPKQGGQRFVDINGGETENTTTFASCREYRGESTITFFPAPEAAGSGQSSAAPPAAIPAGLAFTFELTTPISSDNAAGGDPFSGRLVSALRVKGKTIAPAHAVVEGRLLRVEVRRVAPMGANFVLKLRTVEVAGVKIPIEATRDLRHERRLLLPHRWEENSGVFQLLGGHPVIKAGTRSDWLTN